MLVRVVFLLFFFPFPNLQPRFLPPVPSEHADQVRCGISKRKPLNINAVCTRVPFFFPLSALIRFLSVLLGILARRPYTRAKSCDELLIDDSFIKTRRVVHVLWHFLTLDLQRTDTNAPVSFKLVYKLGRVCGPLRKGVGGGGESDVQVY